MLSISRRQKDSTWRSTENWPQSCVKRFWLVEAEFQWSQGISEQCQVV